jgi:hypothetical protein
MKLIHAITNPRDSKIISLDHLNDAKVCQNIKYLSNIHDHSVTKSSNKSMSFYARKNSLPIVIRECLSTGK